MLIAAYALFAVAHLCIALIGLRTYLRLREAALITLILPVFALVYDDTMAAIGVFIGEGSLLRTLTYPRFVGHALLTPIWIVTSVAIAALAGSAFARKPWVRKGSWWLYALMVVFGIVDALLLLRLVPLREGAVLVYTNAGGLPGPPAPAIIMVLVTIVCGVLVWREIKWPWMLLGALYMLAAAGIPAEVTGFILSASGEVVLATALLATAHRVLRERAPDASATTGR